MSNTITNNKPPVRRLVALDRRIDKNESTALRARWEFGKLVLETRGGDGRLPNGFLAELVERTGKSRSEIKYRQQFAKQYPTEDELANALASFTSWRDVIESFSSGHGTAKPNPARAAGRRLANAAEFLRGDAVFEGLPHEDVDAIRNDLLAAKADIDKALADLDALGASKERHPAGKGTRKAAAVAS
jgi:hypothetical protein